jgi:hypothetical protein
MYPAPVLDPLGFERRGDSKAYRAFATLRVSHHKICGHGWQPTSNALAASVEALQVYDDICLVIHLCVSPLEYMFCLV